MPSKRGQGPKGFETIAYEVFQKAIGEIPKEPSPDPNKDPKAVTLGRMGGLKGGNARANKLTSEQRRSIATKAAETRWSRPSKPPQDDSISTRPLPVVSPASTPSIKTKGTSSGSRKR